MLSHVPELHRITVFPIKSLDGIPVTVCPVRLSGALFGDRRFRLVDAQGKVMNGKRSARLHPIRASYSFGNGHVTLADTLTGDHVTFSLFDERQAVADWFSHRLGVGLTLEENTTTGFPDDLDAPGPSLISTGTLREIASWFPGLTIDELRLRLRANLEVEAEEPFWEDRLVANPSQKFTIGTTVWSAARICQRCVVPTRDSLTGEVYHRFQKVFAERRRATLPAWSPARLFNHHYRVAINTRLVDLGSTDSIALGDSVEPLAS